LDEISDEGMTCTEITIDRNLLESKPIFTVLDSSLLLTSDPV
jgi:hypothetical protein